MLHRLRSPLTTLRRRLNGIAVERTLRGLADAGRLHPRLRAILAEVEVTRDLPYLETGMQEHLADLYLPKKRGTGPLPVVLYLHGGGFRILSKDTHWIMGALFARRGYAVLSINYRLAPRHPYPAAIEDACAALLWLSRQGDKLPIDLDRLILAGESAGANLATGLALALSSPRPEPWARAVWETGLQPRAVLPACGLLQASDCARFARRRPLPQGVRDQLTTTERNYLGAFLPSSPRALELANPLLVLEGDAPTARPLPPFFIPVGTKDPILDDSRRLSAALVRRGVLHEYKVYPGELHAFHAFLWRPQAQQCWRDTFDFLQQHLGPTA